MTIRILIADDHKIVRDGLRMFLALDPALEIVGEASNGVNAVQLTRQTCPDVVVMDLLMPELDGISAISLLRTELPEVEIVAITSVVDNGSINAAIRAGASGYLLKDGNTNELSLAIHAAAAGRVQLTRNEAMELLTFIHLSVSNEPLTLIDNKIIRGLAMGKTSQEIAAELMVSETTVKGDVSSILLKLNLNSRIQIVLYAYQQGML